MSEAWKANHAVSPWRLGLDAAKRNALPGVLLVLFALGIGLGYALVPPVRDAMQAIAVWREGLTHPVAWLFPVATTALFGGAIPWLVQRLRLSETARPRPRDLAYLIAFWGIKGFEINLLYAGLSALVGSGASPGVVASKVALDMAVYCPLWAMPTTVLAYAFMDAGYSWTTMKRRPLRHGWRAWYRWDVVPVMVNNWAVWVPAVAVIYTLPLALQLPFQNLVLCFWSLVLVFMSARLAER